MDRRDATDKISTRILIKYAESNCQGKTVIGYLESIYKRRFTYAERQEILAAYKAIRRREISARRREHIANAQMDAANQKTPRGEYKGV